MKRLIAAAVFAACCVAPVVAQTEAPTEPQANEAVEGNDPEALKLVTDCSARKFETVVEREVDGKMQSSKMKLCGKKGQTDAEWVATLKDAASKISANEEMPQAAKDQLVTALNAEIAKFWEAQPALPRAAESEPVPVKETAEAPVVAEKPATPPAAAIAMPRLSVKCLAPGEKGDGSNCSLIARSTILAVHADSELGSGASLRFLRRGDLRGTIELPSMRLGATGRYKLPSELCAGVASSKVEIQVMASGQVADRYGPYTLRC